jgi:CheY-like chemotaxis protein
VAVLDMSMPGIDGLELAVEIRRRRSAEELPIVMLTSLGQRQALQNAHGAGLAAFLAKPIKASQLFATLVAVVQGQRLAPQPPAPAPAPPIPVLAASLPLRVLVAEDNAINQRVALRLLQRLGYRADVAANGLEVIDAVERQHYDVVLMDIQMPEMDGLQAARWIAQRRGADGAPRVIAMTANAMPGDREAYIDAGMDGYVAKPIDMGDLAAAMTRVAMLARGGAGSPQQADEVLELPRLEHLRSLQDDSQPGLVRELIDMFVADAPGHVAALDDAWREGDVQRLGRAAHRLLSATQNIGAARLSRVCIEIERRCAGGELDGVAALIDALPAEQERASAALLSARARY